MCVERIRLPATTVEREYLLAAQALPQRVTHDETASSDTELRVEPGGEIRLDPVLERGEAQLLKRRCLDRGERDVEAGERLSAPEGICLVQQP